MQTRSKTRATQATKKQKTTQVKKKEMSQMIEYGGRNGGEKLVTEGCLRGYIIGEVIGVGSFGTVYRGFLKGAEYIDAVKVLGFDTKSERQVIEKELKITQMLSDNQIGPEVLDAWICDKEKLAFIVTHRWDGQLPRDICIDERLLMKLASQIEKLHQLGYVHGDINEKNVLIDKDENGKLNGITLADFGHAETIQEWKNQPEWLKTVYEDHIDYPSPYHTREYFIVNNITLDMVLKDPRHLDKALIWYLYKICKN